MIKNKKILIGYKLLFGLLGFSAIITEIATIVERGYFNPFNFFSFFTIESNIFVALVFLLSAVAVAWNKNDKLDMVRAAAAVFMFIVGLGFSLLLAGLENAVFTAVAWDNIALHYIIPAAALVDLLIDPLKRKLPFKRAFLWLLFPVAYLFYSLIRGAVTGWYPYPFLNPDNNGYGAVALYALGIIVMTLVLAWFVCRLSGSKRRPLGL